MSTHNTFSWTDEKNYFLNTLLVWSDVYFFTSKSILWLRIRNALLIQILGSHESPKYRNTTEIPVKNIGIHVSVKDTY